MRMKQSFKYYKVFFIYTALIFIAFISCEEQNIEAGFEEMKQMTIYDYLIENKDSFSSFLEMLEVAGFDKTLSAYNPENEGYTLFLPNNQSVKGFIQKSEQFSSFEELINDTGFVKLFSSYHIVNLGIISDNFPFGALPEYTFSDDLLTVSFITETDTSYFSINNQSPVVLPDIEVSNGVIHIIENALDPVAFTTYEWLELHDEYSIFTDAAKLTGFDKILSANLKNESLDAQPITLLLEHDSLYQKRSVNSVDELIDLISPEDQNYTDPSNPLFNYVGYHLISELYFIDDFVDVATNYSTYSEIPLNIDGRGNDIYINKGKEIFDSIITETDTTYIDYIEFDYDASNVLTQSGVIHFIERVMQQQSPSKATQTFQFFEESLFDQFENEVGSYLIEDPSLLKVINYSGTDLYYVKESSESSAMNADYLLIDGDFIINYSIPKIVQGNYNVILGAEAFDPDNALIEVYIDGNNIGSLIDLSSGGDSNRPFTRIELGTINFARFDQHEITVISVIPGRFLWDYIRFEPISNN